MNEKTIRRVWALESGFNTKNDERDEWFRTHLIFIAKHDKETEHLFFMPLDWAYIEHIRRPDKFENMGNPCWETTSAKLVEASNNGKYKCYETASGTRYHLCQVGELTLG